MVRIIAQAVMLLALVTTASADFANPDDWNNGADLRQIRRTLAGRPDESAGVILEDVEPPTALDAPTAVLHELRAQSVMQHQSARLLAMLVGVVLAQITFSRVRLSL